MNKRFFKAQALAIVMVVLVIASIIGIALFSRISKSRQAAIDQQNSDAAVETADSLLDVLIGADIEALENSINADGTPKTYEGAAMEGLMVALGLSPNLLPDLATWCPGATEESDNTLRLVVQKTGVNTPVEVQPGGLLAFNVQSATNINDPCNLNLFFNGSDASVTSVFIVKKVYEDGTDPVVENYCVNTIETTECVNIADVDYEDSINPPTDYDLVNGIHYLAPKNLAESGLAEIRILPIKGTIKVSSSIIPSDCIEGTQFNPIKITAEANCNGTYRAKQMFLPGSGNLGYSTLFDYGIYDNGLFQP